MPELRAHLPGRSFPGRCCGLWRTHAWAVLEDPMLGRGEAAAERDFSLTVLSPSTPHFPAPLRLGKTGRGAGNEVVPLSLWKKMEEMFMEEILIIQLYFSYFQVKSGLPMIVTFISWPWAFHLIFFTSLVEEESWQSGWMGT